MSNAVERTQPRMPQSITVQVTSTLILPQTARTLDYANINDWVTATEYDYGDIVRGTGGYYWNISSTLTSGATPPTHRDGDVSDDVITWRHIPWDRHTLTLVNVGANEVALARGNPAVAGKGLIMAEDAAYNEGLEGNPQPYDGAWYAIATGGTSTLAIAEG